MLDHFHGRKAWAIVERDDGNFSLRAGPEPVSNKNLTLPTK